jgi:hypothetical protein
LAAASGLTRDPHPAAHDTLKANADALNTLAPNEPGAKFVREAEARAVLAPLIDRLDPNGVGIAMFGGPPPEVTKTPRYEAVLKLTHPMLLEYANEVGLGSNDVTRDPRRLMKLLTQLDEVSSSWDTYSDARIRAKKFAIHWLGMKDDNPSENNPDPLGTARTIVKLLQLPAERAEPHRGLFGDDDAEANDAGGEPKVEH